MRFRLLPLVFLLACTGQGSDSTSRPSVTIGIGPFAEAVTRLAGDFAAVTVLLPPGASAHSYEATPSMMSAFLGSRVFFSAGLPFEQRLAGLARSRETAPVVVDLSAGRLSISEAHGGPDPHFWMDPVLYMSASKQIAEQLVLAFPEQEDKILRNLDALLADLERLDLDTRQRLKSFHGARLVSYHGAFAYFCKRYGLVQVSLEEGSREPGAADLARAMKDLGGSAVNAIAVQPRDAGRSPAAVAERLGSGLVVLDPLAEDYSETVRSVTDFLVAQSSPAGKEGQ